MYFIGDLEGCRSLYVNNQQVATYNIMQLNITDLPFDVRFGL